MFFFGCSRFVSENRNQKKQFQLRNFWSRLKIPWAHCEIELYFPDDLLDELSILDWLKRNRYKRVELDWIMYSVVSVALAFLLYSAFLVFGLPLKEVEKKKDD